MKGARAPGPRKPDWLKVRIPAGEDCRRVSELIARHGLATVCDSARCPNKAECYSSGTATFMILGSVCTRNCRFCSVDRARAGSPLRPGEPSELAGAIAELGLSYAVITSVDRDDLPDRGAAHFAACVAAVKAACPGVRIEVLIPDYREREIGPVLSAGPDVVAHNVETVRRLQAMRDGRASFAASLHTLELAADYARSRGGRPAVKSSLMLGLGETAEEVLAAMDELRAAGCSSLVLGQYLRPTPAQVEVVEYLAPEAFEAYAEAARAKGFASVVSAPLARTSYHARSSYEAGAAFPAAKAAADLVVEAAARRKAARAAVEDEAGT